MDYKVTKLDRRHAGHDTWKYMIIPVKIFPVQGSRELIHKWRAWCWDSWGASSELSWAPIGALWCWDTLESYKTRIYLKSDKELSMFHLRWS